MAPIGTDRGAARGPRALRPARVRPVMRPPRPSGRLLLPLLLAALTLWPPATAAAEAPPSRPLLPPAGQAAVETALDRMYRMDYPAAEETLLRDLPPSSARLFFTGLVRLNRFMDWGDTAALRRAEASWETLVSSRDPEASVPTDGTDPHGPALWRALGLVQLSHAAAVRGETLRAARLALSAERRLRAVDRPEARAALMLLDYYRGRLLERLPLLGPPTFDERTFARRIGATPVLRDLFLGPLFWIHVDRDRHEAADSLTRAFLRRYPDNRLARQMRADGLFHAGALEPALAEQERLRGEYRALRVPESLPLGYYRAVGALARLQAARGRPGEAGALREEWRRAEDGDLGPWLPPSLRKDLRNLDLP